MLSMNKKYDTIPVQNKKVSFEILKHALVIIEDNGYIAGSSPASICLPEDISMKWDDVDVFSKDPFAYEKLVKKFKEMGETPFTETGNSSYYRMHVEGTNYKFNLIKPVARSSKSLCGPPKRVVNDFDFFNIMCYINNEEYGYVYVYDRKDFLELHERKLLKINQIRCPIQIFARLNKYARKGYRFSMEDILKINKLTYEILSRGDNFDRLNKLIEEDTHKTTSGLINVGDEDYSDILGGKFFE